MNANQVLQLLKESIITSGTYRPSESFKGDSSVGIALNGKPILLLGWHDDKDSQSVTERLLINEQFAELVRYIYGDSAGLSKVIVKSSAACPLDLYLAVVKSAQGQTEDGTGKDELQGIVVDDRQDFAVGLCINDSIMKCFYPDAKPLSVQIDINQIPSQSLRLYH